jgi:predicted Zn-dependent protease
MATQPGNNQKPPEFLSTHPADDTRIAGIRSYLPEAMSYYRSQGQAVQPAQSQQQTGG